MASPILHVCVGLALLNIWRPALRRGRPGGAGGPPASRNSFSSPSKHVAKPTPPLRPLCSLWLPCLAAALLACLPDIDYLPGLLVGDMNAYHQGPPHSLLVLLLRFSTKLTRFHHIQSQQSH